MAHETIKYQEETGEVGLWTNSMFGGMPTYQITSPQKNNLMKPRRDLQRLFFDRPIGYFVGAMIGFYILLLILGLSPILSVIGAIAFAFSTNNLVLFEAGHMTKLSAVFSVPLFLSGVVLAFKKKYVYGFLLFSIGLAINILHNHLQMTYLLGILTVILMGFYFFKYLKEKELKHFLKVSLLFLVGAVLAVATSSSKILTTYEYAKDTMRGKPILESNLAAPSTSSETDGLEWNYAMSWSNGWEDLLSSFIPGAVGGSSSEKVGKNSEFVKTYSQLSQRRLSERRAPLYWGSLPGTSGPIYFGAVIFFLFFLGAFNVKGKLKWWIVTGVILTMLLSLGKNFPAFNKFVFDYIPYFNKFRSPNSILSITAVIIPLLAILGLKELTQDPDKREAQLKNLFISFGILGGISILLALFGGYLFDFAGGSDDRMQGLVDSLILDRKTLLRNDSFKTFLFLFVSASAIWMFLKKKLKYEYMITAIAVLIFIDLFGVGTRYVNHGDFERVAKTEKDFKLRAVDQQILEDTDLHYRVIDLTINTFNSSISSYHHKTIGGYHAAKLQRYQDLIDRHIVRNNQEIINMFNTKFVIQGQPGNEQVVLNGAYRGNSWFIDTLTMVENANAEIDALTSFNSAKQAFYHQEFQDYIGAFDPNGQGKIHLTDYSPNKLRYSSFSSEEQFAVFSEMWYGPNKGWKAYIDGEEAEFIRVNYALRGMRIPAGNHEIVYEFKPSTYFVGEKVSLVSSGILLLLLLFVLGRDGYKYFIKKEEVKAS